MSDSRPTQSHRAPKILSISSANTSLDTKNRPGSVLGRAGAISVVLRKLVTPLDLEKDQVKIRIAREA
jgi:hypothetical protein